MSSQIVKLTLCNTCRLLQCTKYVSSYKQKICSLVYSKRYYSDKSDDDRLKDVPKWLHSAQKEWDDGAQEITDKFTDYHGRDATFPYFADVVIIGGGVMGASVAHWLGSRSGLKGDGMKTIVVEKDPTYATAATTLSCGGIRQQFSVPENIHMSMFGAKFLRELKKHLTVRQYEPPDIQFTPCGYLTTSTEEGAQMLFENWKEQRHAGAQVELLLPYDLRSRFPWLKTDEIALATLGMQNEGWFDPWALLDAFKRKAISEGVQFVKGEMVDWVQERDDTFFHAAVDQGEYDRLKGIKVRMDDGSIREIQGAKFVLCAGADSGRLSSMLGVGHGENENSVPLPVEPRKRYVYVVHAPDGPGLDSPFYIDYTGLYFRRDGLMGNYLCGMSPPANQEPDASNFDVDYTFFEESVWPIMAARVPGFENLKLKSAWAGHYDYNLFDQNAIIGQHPYYDNLYYLTGFSGHGIQQAPAAGRGIAELILDQEYKTLDLSRLSFDRLILKEPLYENNII